MKVQIQSKNPQNQIPVRGGGVVIAPGIRKVSERVDSNGNIIDPRTKRVIKKI